ncbi:MAG: carboxypeptidase-like regulatory domain-containing protein, partial [Candidatus Aegiribacteria sp.]|nr:carboxypeptidase-like regulatory domain-containing protein [Candidatus Aegiribacteria sp.]
MFTDSTGFSDFKTVDVIAPGPITGFHDVLSDSAARAIGMCDEWLRDDLAIRLTDLLYEVVDNDMPVLPAFSDVNGDDLEDLVLNGGAGHPVTRIFLAPDWTEITGNLRSIEFRRFCDLNNDGLSDSAFISDEGVLNLFSRDTVVHVTEGFDINGVSGTALGNMEGDGLADLVIGTDSGNLLIYRNRGSINDPCFLPFVSESRVLFPMNAGAFSSPEVFLSGDSMLIAAVGTQQNGLKFYTTGAGGSMMSREWMTIDAPCHRDMLLNISPVEVDLSGEQVLVCGTRNGVLYETRPGSDSLRLLHLSAVPGTYPSLALASVNGDEFPDLIAGTMEGDVFYLPGYEGWFDGNWERIDNFPGIPSGAPAAWKNGLVFGSRDGEIRYFARDDSGAWVDSTENSEFCNIDVGEYSAPDFADMNGDGSEELIVGNSRGSLICFELDENAVDGDPLYVERFSWKFEPNSAVSDIQSYYSRYFAPYSVFRSPSGVREVNAFSREIMKAEPQHRDEIAYCIAHTPTEVLRAMYENGDSDLFSVNVSEMYEMAEKLDYVRLLDYGDETVCQLKTESGWIEISGENYYRFVVHPRILFEIPARVNTEYWSTERDTASVSFEEWLHHEPDSLYAGSGDHVFWREFIPSDSAGGRTLEERMTEAVLYEEAVVRLCNFQSHSQPGGLMTFGYMTNDLQPMVIYRKSYGSCGEQSILQTALCRAFFIPAYVVGCRGEDHQWNHYLDPASVRWNHWDINYGISGIGNVWVSGEGVNHSRKNISTITAFGPDNEVWPVTGSVLVPPGSGYMPEDSGYTCTAHVDILVIDPEGTPIEGAMVLARSHWRNANSVSEFNYTDESGTCAFHLGWEPNGGYTIDVISPFGSTGSSNVSFTEGRNYSLTYTVPISVPQKQIISLPDHDHSQDFTVQGMLYPVSYFRSSLYSLDDEEDDSAYRGRMWSSWRTTDSPGVAVFMNAENFRDYRNGLDCKAVPYPFNPEPGDTCIAVFDNRSSMFTWREFRFSPELHSEEVYAFHDVSDWFSETPSYREPVAVSCYPDYSFSGSDDTLSWIRHYQGIELQQDDPDDPLSSAQVLGPFRIPTGQRSLSIGCTGDQTGLDVDIFLFVDRNANRAVDDMSELAASSTSPTSNENISLAEPDTSAAYWIFVHGWQVPEEGGIIDLGFSFDPEMLAVHSLRPTG